MNYRIEELRVWFLMYCGKNCEKKGIDVLKKVFLKIKKKTQFIMSKSMNKYLLQIK